MPTFSFLDLRYSLSKRKLLKKPSKLLKQRSAAFPVYLPDVTELKQVFSKFDTNKDGKISPDEYTAMLRALGKGSSEVQRIFEVADADGDGFIDFDEFVEVQRGGGVRTADLHRAFDVYDRNNDGKISAEEVHEMMRKLGERCSLEECRRMVRAVDANGDGVIDHAEFIKMMTRTMQTY